MEIPTKQFYVAGFKGKFEVDKKPAQAIGGGMIYQAFWHGTRHEKHEFASGITRDAALRSLIKRITARRLKTVE